MTGIVDINSVDVLNNKNKLTAQLRALEKLSLNELDVKISADKMLKDEEYFNIVIDELYAIDHQEIKAVIDEIKQLAQKPEPVQTPTTPEKNNTFMFIAFGMVLVIAVFLVFYFTQQTKPHATPPAQLAAQSVNHQVAAKPVADSSITQAGIVAPLTLPVASPEMAFKLHGSNTIGEKLAPALIEGYLKKQGINQYKWIQGDSNVERTIQYISNDKAFAIELHAHGSSTAFKNLSTGTAQLGMASRRIKDKELVALTDTLGDLSKVGNEHIVGLDGLAVIVNQNNPIKEVSTEVLSKIFSGEIANWSEIGGPNKPIELYSRDTNSGTWDTFKNLVLKKYKRKLAPNAIRLESSSDLTTKVSQNEFAIGFIGLNYIKHNKALAISAGTDTKSIFPTRFTVGTEDYALSRRLYFYSPTNASNIVKDFAQYAISVDGQNIVEKTGLISQNIKVESVYPIAGAPATYNKYTENGKRLSLNFRFNYQDKDLDNKGKRDLLRLVSFIEDNPGRRIVLMGFSDSIGEAAKNAALSLRRAQSVEQELLARGIPVLATEGLGEQLPIASNITSAGRDRNRRVEVWVL